jgi:hypothetical protein
MPWSFSVGGVGSVYGFVFASPDDLMGLGLDMPSVTALHEHFEGMQRCRL